MGLWDAFRGKTSPTIPAPQKPKLTADFGTYPNGALVDGTVVPYTLFNKSINPVDIYLVNQQQTRRNAMFAAWISKVAEGCKLLGKPMTFSIEQIQSDWYVQPSFAVLQIDGGRADYVTHYHMDAWTPDIAVHVLIGRS